MTGSGAGAGAGPGAGPGAGAGAGAGAAILLAGGRASRVGGAAKPLFEVSGTTLLQRAVDAVDGCAQVVVVADPVPTVARSAGVAGDAGSAGEAATGPAPRAVTWVREDPPFGGPAAAVVAGLSALSELSAPSGLTTGSAPRAVPLDMPRAVDLTWTYLLACDLPGIEAAVAHLAAAVRSAGTETDGFRLRAPGSDRPQWLVGVYRTAALRRQAALLPEGARGASMAALLGPLRVEEVDAPEHETADVDTWDDLAAARERAGDTPRGPEHLTVPHQATPVRSSRP
jgi:molybdopterin-guanine dinucleotide biosynthesis protein A